MKLAQSNYFFLGDTAGEQAVDEFPGFDVVNLELCKHLFKSFDI
jgi:hypothetical protein